MTVADILRMKDTRIITVRLRETAATAAMLLERENIGALVVKDVSRTEGNIVVGVFSERDLARAIARHGAAALEMPIARLLAKPLVSCGERDTLDTVLRLMDKHQVRLLPVMEEHTLIGVISISDIVRNAVLQSESGVARSLPAALHA
ncbi:MAG: CBS domain-containing protein [Alphaproteobacteria bacterium]|nr:CBS domain-containing protein [Alphaproteobacteria bacterium]